MNAISHGERPSVAIEKRLILCLATLLVVNPVIVFLLTKSVVITILAPTIAVLSIQLSCSQPRLKLLTAYLFNAFALLSIFVHAETILLFGYPNYVIKNLYTIEDGYYLNKPLLDERFVDSEYEATYRTNTQGLRISNGHDPTRIVKTTDWLVIGDSFTQGAQVEFEELFTTRLNARFPDKIVLNSGISGLGLGNEYNLYANYGYVYEPNLVILLVGSFNDFMNVEPRRASFTDRVMAHSAFVRLLLTDLRFQDDIELPLGRWTEPFYSNPLDNTYYNVFYTESSPYKKQDIADFKRYLTLLNNATASHGAQLLVALLPTREQIDADALEEVTREFSIDSTALDMRRPNDLLEGMTADLNVAFVDLLPDFIDANKKIFFDRDEHMTIAGHQVVADAIGNYIESRQEPSTARMLSRQLVGDRYPMFSNDGMQITYQSFRDGNMELFLADSSFNKPKQLTADSVDQSHPSLSRDASRIIFTEGLAESFETEVVIMDLSGANKRELTVGDFEFGAIPTFSPTNSQVTYAAWSHDERSNNYTNPQIVVRDLLSGVVKPITDGRSESWRPVFSPDERQLVYISRINNQYDLFSYDFSTASERRLTKTPFDEWDPQFSPNGSHLVYAAHADNNWDLFLLNLKTNITIQLTATKGDEWDPSISPDGSLILFAGQFGLVDAVYSMPYPR